MLVLSAVADNTKKTEKPAAKKGRRTRLKIQTVDEDKEVDDKWSRVSELRVRFLWGLGSEDRARD